MSINALAKEYFPHSDEELVSGYLPFEQTEFTPEKEEAVRVLTNPNGRGNAAYDLEAEAQMPAQDKLVKVHGWFHGKTGFSAMFLWGSGRQDAFVIVDIPEAAEGSPEVQAQSARIISFADAIKNLKNKER